MDLRIGVEKVKKTLKMRTPFLTFPTFNITLLSSDFQKSVFNINKLVFQYMIDYNGVVYILHASVYYGITYI